MESSILIDKIINPIILTAVGTAGGALIANILNEKKLEYLEREKQINAFNKLVIDCSTHVNHLILYLEEIIQHYINYIDQKPIAINFLENKNSNRPMIDARKFYLPKIDYKDIKTLCSESSANVMAMKAASTYCALLPQVFVCEEDLHKKINEVTELQLHGSEDEALKLYFGVSQNEVRNEVILPSLINIINICNLSILLLVEIVDIETKNKINMKISYDRCKFNKLPNLITLNLNDVMNKPIYPSKEDFDYFQNNPSK